MTAHTCDPAPPISPSKISEAMGVRPARSCTQQQLQQQSPADDSAEQVCAVARLQPHCCPWQASQLCWLYKAKSRETSTFGRAAMRRPWSANTTANAAADANATVPPRLDGRHDASAACAMGTHWAPPPPLSIRRRSLWSAIMSPISWRERALAPLILNEY